MPLKPLLRWIIGPVKPAGFTCLKQSIRHIKEIYPEFDLAICYNQLKPNQLEYLNSTNINLIDQQIYSPSFPILSQTGYHVHHKLYPPRLRPNSHEIVIDNDIILFKRIPEIDVFLQNDAVLLYQGLNGAHGSFGKHIPHGLRINSGIFGMPPQFDFIEMMKPFLYPDIVWKDKYDEQGLVAATLLRYHKYYIIPLTTVPIIGDEWSIKKLTNPFTCGYHFVGLNILDQHPSWLEYNKILFL